MFCRRLNLGRVVLLCAGFAVPVSILGCGALDPCSAPTTAVLTTDRHQLPNADTSSVQATLRAVVLAGIPPYQFEWSVRDPAGEPADHLLDDAAVQTPHFSAGPLNGPYVITCVVTDERGCAHMSDLVVTVGASSALGLTAERYGVAVGGGPLGTTTVFLDVPNGPEPHDVTWSVLSPDGNRDRDRLIIDDPFAPRFVSGDEVGAYVLTATVVDAAGAETFTSIVVIVGQELGLDVAAAKSSVLPGGGTDGMTTLLATPIGGKSPYFYDWEIVGPDSENHNETLWDRTVRDPIFESIDLAGQFLARCAVTDAEGTVMIGSIPIVVGKQLTLDVVADRLALTAGGVGSTTSLTADVRGGRAPLEIVWSVTGPDDADSTERLCTTTGSDTIFQSAGDVGRYLIRCTVEDADGVIVGDSVMLAVGGTLAVVVVADKNAVAASSGSEGSTSLTARILGGVPPFGYAWAAVDPNGNDAAALLGAADSASPTFGGASVSGTYSILCTVTDGDGDVAIGAVHLTVGQPLSADVTTERQSLVAGGGVGGQTQLSSVVLGGVAPYNYQWSALAPDNTVATARLDSIFSANPVFTTSSITGTYRLTLTVIDARGTAFGDSVEVVVGSTGSGSSGQNLSLDVSTAKQILAPTDTTSLATVVTGGVAPLTYSWSVTDPAGAADNGRLNSTTASAVTFTSVTTFGTYRVQCTGTDATAATFTDSIQLTVTDGFVLNLTASATQGVSGTTINLFADRTGGEANFDFTWTCVDSGGVFGGTFSTGSSGVGQAQQSAADDVVNAWTAPVSSGSSAETYRITCVATDAQGSAFSETVHIVIDPPTKPSVDLVPNTIFIEPGDAVSLTAVQSDGVANFDYVWAATDPVGAVAGTFTTGATGTGAATQTGQGGSAVNTWTAPSAPLGTYKLQVTLNDAFGSTATDTIYLVVRSPLSLNVTASDTFVVPSTSVTFLADRTGGEANYAYAWSATTSGGAAAGTFTIGSSGTGAAAQTGQTDDATNAWSTASAGTYTIRCTITDSAGQTFTDSITVVVTTIGGFSLNVTSDQVLLRPGETANLTGDRTGGTANFSYTWTALNEAGASAGAFGAANQSGVADDTTNTWISPTGPGVEGTYRIGCTATDAAGATFTDTLFITVSSLAVQNVFIDPDGPKSNNVFTGTALNAFAGIGDPGQQISAGLNHPDYPRNIVVIITDANNSVGGGSVRVTGVDARGQSQAEVFAIAASAGGSSTNTGASPFATVTRVDVFSFTGLDGDEQITVGTGSKFGLTGVLESAADVLYVNENGTAVTSGFTLDTTGGQQGITFSTAPNGNRHFIVVFMAH